nr:U-box domain-containing protein 36 [Ipomoea batatas]
MSCEIEEESPSRYGDGGVSNLDGIREEIETARSSDGFSGGDHDGAAVYVAVGNATSLLRGVRSRAWMRCVGHSKTPSSLIRPLLFSSSSLISSRKPSTSHLHNVIIFFFAGTAEVCNSVVKGLDRVFRFRGPGLIPKSNSPCRTALSFSSSLYHKLILPSPSIMGMIPLSQVNPEQKENHMAQERSKRSQFLQKFLHVCSASQDYRLTV